MHGKLLERWQILAGMRDRLGKPALFTMMLIALLTPYAAPSRASLVADLHRARRMWSEARKGYESIRLVYEIKNQLDQRPEREMSAKKSRPEFRAVETASTRTDRIVKRALARPVKNTSIATHRENAAEPLTVGFVREPRSEVLEVSDENIVVPPFPPHPRPARLDAAFEPAVAQRGWSEIRLYPPPVPLTKGNFQIRFANRMHRPPYTPL